jgi:ethanolamine ammonia-lyase large subunit
MKREGENVTVPDAMPPTLTPLGNIRVPEPAADESYAIRVLDRDFAFHGLKALLGAADCSKAGDRNAGLAAADELAREAARSLLASLTLAHLYDHPLTDRRGRIDTVMRVNYDIDREVFDSISKLNLGEFKNLLLRSSAHEIAPLGRGLTGVMAAALAKICDVHELVLLAQKMPRTSRARTTLGATGTLASRLQPNHPTDDLRGVTLLVYWGLSLASGDALIGINPAVDTVDNVDVLLRHLDKLRRATAAPTQICVLAHIKTQLACLDRGAPVEILFQSLAGTEDTLTGEFDVTVDLLDEGYRAMSRRGALRDVTGQCMYFETGQGSEFSYGKHNGIDMTTTEALCYGLARRYDPFMVNNVTGFIGPETHLDNFEMIVANLQDHFMGKLLGLPMGMAPCFTLHSQITLEGQQMATQLLTAAGANYYMDVALNTDRMLAYFDTSAHDVQTLRETYHRQPAPEFLAWAAERGILARDGQRQVSRGPHWGNPRQFCESDEAFNELLRATPSMHGLATAGPRPEEHAGRQARLHQAIGREAMHAELDVEALQRLADFRLIATEATDRRAHLNHPELGSRLSAADLARLAPEGNQVQIVVSDGLSAEAARDNLPSLLGVLGDALAARKIRVGRPMLARYARVKLAEPIATAVEADLVVHLLGERPGGDAQAARSLSAYLVFRRDAATSSDETKSKSEPSFEYTVVSNIHCGGLPPLEAGAVIAEKIFQILNLRAAGNRLEALLGATRGK